MNMTRDGRELNSNIDFIEIFRILIGGKWLVFSTMLVFFIFGAVYVVLTPHRYEAKLFIIPPTQNDIAQFNFGRGGSAELPLISVKDVYAAYVRSLYSESLRREFFKNIYVPSLPAEQRKSLSSDLYRQLGASLNVVRGGRDQPDRYLITATSDSAENAARWVTEYARIAGEGAKREMLASVLSDASIKADNLHKQIVGEQESARQEREDQIARLKEALRVARSIGLEKPPIISSELAAQMSGDLTYMRGSNALEAEIENLNERPSNDPFIANLRRQEAEVRFYRGLKIDPSLVEVYQQDGDIVEPDRPAGPRAFIVIGIAVLLGAGVGACLAIFRHSWVRRMV